MTTTFCQELPAEWIEKRLKFAAPLRIERAEATSEHADYLGLENIQSWTGKLLQTANGEPVSDEDAAGGTANRFRKGDVLFGKLRPYLAKALHAGMDGVCTTELLVLTPQPDLHPRFLLYTVLSPEFVGQVDASTFGAKMPRANWDFIGSMKVPVPSFDIQRRIADYLNRETKRIDALVAEKERMLALLEEKRRSLVNMAIEHPLTKMLRIQHAARIVSKPIPRLDDETYVPIGLFNRGRGIFHKEPSFGIDLGDSDFFFLQKDDLELIRK